VFRSIGSGSIFFIVFSLFGGRKRFCVNAKKARWRAARFEVAGSGGKGGVLAALNGEKRRQSCGSPAGGVLAAKRRKKRP
jgi:hypothetical protein